MFAFVYSVIRFELMFSTYKMKDHKQWIQFFLFAIFWIQTSQCASPACTYQQFVNPNQVYYIYSPGYPTNYRGAQDCLWTATAAAGTQMRLSCTKVQLPYSPSCSLDKLLVSRTGKANFADANRYCGTTTFTIDSTSNAMTIGLKSPSSSQGGQFLCSLSAIAPVSNCDCGWQNQKRIVGGTSTDVNEFPMMGALISSDTRSVFCGATIIAANYAVSAAHCLTTGNTLQIRPVSSTGLLVGDWDISTGQDTSAAKLYAIAQFIVHPSYVVQNFLNDIGLIRTSQPIAFSLFVGPACLPFVYRASNIEGIAVTALGWGTVSFGGPQSDILQKVNLNVIPRSQCTSSYPSLLPSQFCTYTPNKDACQADSGGPELWRSSFNTRVQLMGVISYGKSCATRTPGVSSDVRAYLDWIVQNTPGANYCVKS